MKAQRKAAAAARAFRFLDTSPQKQVRATSVTRALQQVKLHFAEIHNLYWNLFIAALGTHFRALKPMF